VGIPKISEIIQLWRERKGVDSHVTAQVQLIDDGEPIFRNAKVIDLTSKGALVEISHCLEKGQKLVLMLQGIQSELPDVFNTDTPGLPTTFDIKTSITVSEILQQHSADGACRAHVNFLGNYQIMRTSRRPEREEFRE
jgi:hypothetical protein